MMKTRKEKTVAGILGILMILAGPVYSAEAQNNPPKNGWFSWGAQKKNAVNTPKTPAPVSAKATPAGNTVVQPFGRPPRPEDKKKLEKMQKNAKQIERLQNIEQARIANETNQKLQNLVHVTEAAKAARDTQSLEVQKIAEQAKVQQQLLKGLDNSRKVTPPVKVSDTDEILRQEKIRTIRQQTEQSQRVLQTLDRNRR